MTGSKIKVSEIVSLDSLVLDGDLSKTKEMMMTGNNTLRSPKFQLGKMLKAERPLTGNSYKSSYGKNMSTLALDESELGILNAIGCKTTALNRFPMIFFEEDMKPKPEVQERRNPMKEINIHVISRNNSASFMKKKPNMMGKAEPLILGRSINLGQSRPISRGIGDKSRLSDKSVGNGRF